jgi:uncharacterized phiE125 gp8 family phage protein
MYVSQTRSTTLPVSLNSVKDQLRINRDEPDHDADLTNLILAARDWIEDEIHQTLITTSQSATWDEWPGERIYLPAWPVDSITSVSYTDVDGTTQTLSSALYRTSFTSYPAYVMPAIDEDWPDLLLDAIDAVTITWSAGYGSAETDVPEMIQHLIRVLVAEWFYNREGTTEMNVNELPFAIRAMIYQVRVNEWQRFRSQ